MSNTLNINYCLLIHLFTKFQKVYIDRDKISNYLIQMENRVTDVLKNLRDKREISIEQYKDLNPSRLRPGIMYGLAKVHKIVTDDLPFFRLICLPSVHQHTTLKSF